MPNVVYTANTCALVNDANPLIYQTSKVPVIADPMSGSTMGLLMLISTLQYQAPYMNPKYSDAGEKAGHAAFIQVGGQAMQDRATNYATKQGQSTAYSLGLTDLEMGIVGGTYKTIRSKEFNVRGPRFWGIKPNLTATPTSANIGFKYEW